MTCHAAALSALVLCSLSCASAPLPPAPRGSASSTPPAATRVDVQLRPVADAADAADEAAVAAVLPDVVAVRRAIHAHPELGEREHVTAGRIADWLRADGLEVRTGIGGTGVLGLLRGGRPGPVVAYRADMDALPVHEQTGLAFASQRTDQWNGAEVGVMHACGHDVHMAVALGVARVLARDEVRRELPGSVLFVFQPAEEGMPDPGLHGAARMLAEGAFEDPRPDVVLGLHVDPSLDVGTVAAVNGGAMAAVDRFLVEIHGKQAHGAYPQAGIDPIVTASHLVTALQSIAARNVNTLDSVVVTVGKLEAGNRFNIIPERADLLGTIRTHDEQVRAHVHERLEALAHGVAESFGARAEVEIRGITPVTSNDADLVARLRPVMEGVVGEGRLIDVRPHMGGEDFAFFANEVPGLYYFLGVRDPAQGPAAGIHTPRFDPDERALEVGLKVSLALVRACLEG